MTNPKKTWGPVDAGVDAVTVRYADGKVSIVDLSSFRPEMVARTAAWNRAHQKEIADGSDAPGAVILTITESKGFSIIELDVFKPPVDE